MRLEGIVADVIQAPKLEPRIMRYELSDSLWGTVREGVGPLFRSEA
jgi:hypothetical protein